MYACICTSIYMYYIYMYICIYIYLSIFIYLFVIYLFLSCPPFLQPSPQLAPALLHVFIHVSTSLCMFYLVGIHTHTHAHVLQKTLLGTLISFKKLKNKSNIKIKGGETLNPVSKHWSSRSCHGPARGRCCASARNRRCSSPELAVRFQQSPKFLTVRAPY